MGYWQSKSIINHYVADSVEGPFELVGTAFSSDTATYHNPQICKVGDTYVLVFLCKPATSGSLQSIGMATANSLYGPWTENPNNPIIKPVTGTSNAAHASNPTFLVDRDGKFRIYYKSMSEGSNCREISLAIAADLNTSLEANNARGPYLNPDYSNKKTISAAIAESTFQQSERQARLRIDPNGPAVREAYVMYRCKPGSLEKKPEARGGKKMDKDAALYDVKLPALISADGTVVSAQIPDGIPAYCFILIDANNFQTYSDVEASNSGL